MKNNLRLRRLAIFGIIILLISVLVPFTYYWNFRKFPLSDDPGNWGTLGDYIGGILNPLLSFSGFILLLINLFVQLIQNEQNEERYNREEIDRRISLIAPILSEIHNRLIRDLQAYPASNAPPFATNTRSTGSHPVYWRIADDCQLLYSFLRMIENLQPDSPFLIYYRNQYRSSAIELAGRGYANAEVRDFFNSH